MVKVVCPGYDATQESVMSSVCIAGDIHSRVDLAREAVKLAAGRRLVFLGDLFDGPQGAAGSVECVRLIRAAGAELVLGNHEVYPLFAESPSELATWWGEPEQATRLWSESQEILGLLTGEELDWLRMRPLWLRGNGWVATHAKVPSSLPAQYIVGKPSEEQIQLFDHTDTKAFWAEEYGGAFGMAFVGHTRRSKLGKWEWKHARLLDWDAKKGGTSAFAVMQDGNVEVRGL